MKRFTSILILSLTVAMVSAQQVADSIYIRFTNGNVVRFLITEISSMGFEPLSVPEVPETPEVPEFPEADNSIVFDKLVPSVSVKRLLEKAGTACTDTLGRIVITDEQYNEIKTFTDNLVSGTDGQYSKYKKCFDWVRINVKYAQGYVNNDPYPVFTTKSAVCQGYANLLHVMLRTQGIPAMVVNGYMQSGIYNGMLSGPGHAWNYVCCDGVWYVSDPTNSGEFAMSSIDSYKTWLEPTSMDVVVFKEDYCWLNFNECFLNIAKVVTDKSFFVTPYSVEGFRVTCFNPLEELPSNVRELYIGENITSLGEGVMGLKDKAPNVEYATVDPDNKCFSSHAGAVYYSDGYKPTDVFKIINKNSPAYIPAKLKRLELKAVENSESGITYAKETVSGHNGIEEIVFPKGTSLIENGAVEKCPNLKVAYIPLGARFQSSAFSGVHSDFKMIIVE